MTINYSQLLSVKEELDDLVSKGMRSTALSFVRNVTYSSPVDSGRFRANWVVGIGSPDENEYPNRTNLQGAIARASSEIKKFTFTGREVIYINNNLPYAARLNDGYSKQAGKFFVEVAARQSGINIKDGAL